MSYRVRKKLQENVVHKFGLAGAGVLASDLGKEQTLCGSLAYWLVVCSIVPLVLLVTILVRSLCLLYTHFTVCPELRSRAVHTATSWGAEYTSLASAVDTVSMARTASTGRLSLSVASTLPYSPAICSGDLGLATSGLCVRRCVRTWCAASMRGRRRTTRGRRATWPGASATRCSTPPSAAWRAWWPARLAWAAA